MSYSRNCVPARMARIALLLPAGLLKLEIVFLFSIVCWHFGHSGLSLSRVRKLAAVTASKCLAKGC